MSSNWIDFVKNIEEVKVPLLAETLKSQQEANKKGVRFIPPIYENVFHYLKYYNVVTNALVEAKYLSGQKQTKENNNVVWLSKKLLPILEMEAEYLMIILNFYVYQK